MAKILIVDDSAFARNTLSRIVEHGGHEVVGRAENGSEAMALFKSRNPELVTLDYLMEGQNGDDVLDEIMQHDSSAKVIMISGSGDHAIGARALEGGAKFFLEKPLVFRDILKVIDQVMVA
ncbi:MAG: response regulator [Xanthomonadales bacterium]|nr:response regulator [Gammaproteobacteria bacterium]NNE04340.1 response regulator [Xanthomonadales bacterium]NNL94092.1 response regulator [Xanthomonadales bacterium]